MDNKKTESDDVKNKAGNSDEEISDKSEKSDKNEKTDNSEKTDKSEVSKTKSPRPRTRKSPTEKAKKKVDLEKKHIQVLNASEAPIKSVIMYSDRAEVTRIATITLLPGITEVTLTGLTVSLDKDSIRVAGGKGKAVICEVTHNKKILSEDKILDEDNKKLKELDESIQNIELELSRLAKVMRWLEGWSESVRSSNIKVLPSFENDASFEHHGMDIFSSGNLDRTTEFLQFYTQSLTEYDKRNYDLLLNSRELKKEKEILEQKIQFSVPSKDVNEIIVTLQANEKKKVTLALAYLVSNSDWRASYDVRVTSSLKDLELHYYGSVSNRTNEDWNEVDIALSTAQPSIDGQPPELKTRNVYLGQHIPKSRRVKDNSKINSMKRKEKQDRKKSSGGLEAKVVQSGSFVNFNIQRSVTIQSALKEYKVLIKVIKLPASFNYNVVPALSPYAYLKAVIMNDSEYPLLEGPLSVFMDGNFIARSNLQATSQNETVGIYLGVDPSIKVEHRPEKSNKGPKLLQRTARDEHKNVTVITNNKTASIKVSMQCQLPKSTDSSIKVKLVEPELNIPDNIPEPAEDAPVAILPTHCIRWQFNVSAGEKKDITFHYNIDHPVDRDYYEE